MSNEKKKKILVIDDEPDTVTYIVTLLQDNGYETISAGNGIEGMEIAKSEIPDLIILDVSMPEQSGMGFYKSIIKDQKLATTPVVFVTGVTGFAGDDHAIEKFLGKMRNVPSPAGYFPKPLEREEFIKKVAEILN